MWYPYTPIASEYYPLVQIELLFPRKSLFLTLALVDSGADTSLFDIAIAKQCGVKIDDHPVKYNRGAGGFIFQVWDFPIMARFQNLNFQLKASWCSMREPKTGRLLSFNLLGRNDFFNTFEITFDQPNKRMRIVPFGKK